MLKQVWHIELLHLSLTVSCLKHKEKDTEPTDHNYVMRRCNWKLMCNAIHEQF